MALLSSGASSLGYKSLWAKALVLAKASCWVCEFRVVNWLVGRGPRAEDLTV